MLEVLQIGCTCLCFCPQSTVLNATAGMTRQKATMGAASVGMMASVSWGAWRGSSGSGSGKADGIGTWPKAVAMAQGGGSVSGSCDSEKALQRSSAADASK